MTLEFEQRLDAVNLDQRMLTLVGRNIEQFRHLISELFDIDQQEQIYAALLHMLELHKDQEDRPDGMPYISHPLEAARIVVEDFGIDDSELAIAALLHDSVEDQGLKLAKAGLDEKYGEDSEGEDSPKVHEDEIRSLALSRIAETYGERVASVISKLSSPDFGEMAKKECDPADKEKFQAIKHKLYKENVEATIEDPDVLVVKLADFLHNFTNAAELEDSPQKQKYIQKYVPVAQVFIDRLNGDNLPAQISAHKEMIISRLKATSAILIKAAKLQKE